MLQIVYVSAARLSYTPEALDQLKSNVKQRNEARDLTGLLLYRAGAFFEVLEGAQEDVDEVFDEIRKYESQGHIRVLVRRFIHKHEFDSWSMAVLDPESRLEPGFDFFNPGEPKALLAGPPTAARRHMDLFASGFHHPLDLLEARPMETPDRPRYEAPNGLYRADKPRLLFGR